MTMLRVAWETDDYETAISLHRQQAKVGFSAQAWALRVKVREVDPDRPI